LIEKAVADLHSKVVKKILSNVPPPNVPATIAKKKSSKTLVDSGNMLGKVGMRIRREGNYVIGEVGIFDPDTAEYASYNEFGAPKANVPERSFLRSTWDEEIDKISAELEDDIFNNITNKF